MLISLLSWIKEKVDNLYYRRYYQTNREALIRATFPGIHEVNDYKRLESYLTTLGEHWKRELVNALMSFYWWEVANLNANKKYDKAIEYEWIITFCSSIDAYLAELSILNKK